MPTAPINNSMGNNTVHQVNSNKVTNTVFNTNKECNNSNVQIRRSKIKTVYRCIHSVLNSLGMSMYMSMCVCMSVCLVSCQMDKEQHLA